MGKKLISLLVAMTILFTSFGFENVYANVYWDNSDIGRREEPETEEPDHTGQYYDDMNERWEDYKFEDIRISGIYWEYSKIMFDVENIPTDDVITLYSREKGAKKWIKRGNLKPIAYKNYYPEWFTGTTVMDYNLEPGTVYQYKIYSKMFKKYSSVIEACTCLKTPKITKKGNTVSWKPVKGCDFYEVYYMKKWDYGEGYVTKTKLYSTKVKKNKTSYTVKISDKKHIKVTYFDVLACKKYGKDYLDSTDECLPTKGNKEITYFNYKKIKK